MGFTFQYGSYRHDVGECSIGHSVSPIFDGRGNQKSTLEKLSISGKIHADNVSDLTSKIDLLIKAYSVNGKDACLYDDSGSRTRHCLLNNNSVNGVVVTSLPQFPESDGAEYTTYRSYSISLEAEYYSSSTSPLSSFQESLSVTGTGGEKRVFIEVSEGLPVEQVVRQNTIVTAVQSGSAIGVYGYPPVPSPLFPESLLSNSVSINKNSPTRNINGSFTNYEIQWSYQFVSSGQLSGIPTQV